LLICKSDRAPDDVRDSGKAKGRIVVSTIASEKAEREREATPLFADLVTVLLGGKGHWRKCFGLYGAEGRSHGCRLRSLQILAQVPVRLKVGLEVIPRP